MKISSLCDRDRIQTCNLLIRSQMLYSVELRDPFSLTVAKVRTFSTITKHRDYFFNAKERKMSSNAL